MNRRKVVYTCLFGYSEKFLDITYDHNDDIDFVCITDDASLKSEFWNIVIAPKSLMDSHRRSKFFKHCPHEIFPNYTSSLYIDNTVKLIKSPNVFFNIIENSQFSMFMFNHPDRNCIYAEAELLKQLKFDSKYQIDEQINYYNKIGYPKNNGLHASTVLLRNHNENQIKNIMNEWHNQTLRYSKRDQLSFDVVKYFYDLKVGEFDGDLQNNDLIEWPHPRDGVRLPRDFDEHEYLEINPDVATSGIDARKHYLEFGISEERSYRISQSPSSPALAKFSIDENDERGRRLLHSPSGGLNEPTFAMWQLLLTELPWTDIVDVGANYGEMLVGAELPSRARVTAIEPNPYIFPLLAKNLRQGDVHCKCLPVAISNCIGAAEFCIDRKWSGFSRLLDVNTELNPNNEKIYVPVITLDLILKFPKNNNLLLKIDTEGSDISVLMSAEKSIENSSNFSCLIELLHLDDNEISFLLEKFDVELYQPEKREFVKVSPPTIDEFRKITAKSHIYKNDAIIRKRASERRTTLPSIMNRVRRVFRRDLT